jgi:hypothetical protein|tara:strand:- start:13033 stop:14037 length:1005 start_codon:yes stop_codon:yes gene_type:complete
MFFEFPDTAEFPENKEPRFPEKVKTSHLFREQNAFKSDMRELGNIIDKQMDPSPDEKKIRSRQMARIVEFGREYYSFKGFKPRSDLSGSKAFDDLIKNGIHMAQTDVSKLQALFLDKALKLRDKDPATGLTDYDRGFVDNSSDSINAVTEVLTKTGQLQAATKFRGGGNLRVRNVTVHCAMPGDRHHFQQYRDCKTATNLINMHLDPKPSIIKAIIYLNEVGIDDGPFCWIDGSHAWDYDEFERIFAWGNSVGNYCHTPAHRRVMNSFPKRLRGNAIAGRLIPDGTALSKKITKALTPRLSKDSNCMIFTPTFGWHRGGFCKSGTRINLQVKMT